MGGEDDGGNFFFVICMFCFSFKEKEFKKAHFYAQLSPVREEEEEAAGELIPATASTTTAIVRVNAAVCCRC